MSDWLFGLARWIAGKDRAEWIDAMQAEASTIETDSTGWAVGCLWACLKDRMLREWRFLLAILAFPICAYLLGLAFFFPLAWLRQHHWIPGWVIVGSALFSPLPFAFLLGRMRPERPAYVAATICFLLATFFPLTLFWMEFGKSPFSWFGEDSTWYMMTPIAGLTCALLVWIGGVWMGSHWSQRRN